MSNLRWRRLSHLVNSLLKEYFTVGEVQPFAKWDTNQGKFIDLKLLDTDYINVTRHYMLNAKYWAGLCGTKETTEAFEARKKVDELVKLCNAADSHALVIKQQLGLLTKPDYDFKPYEGTPNVENLANHLRQMTCYPKG